MIKPSLAYRWFTLVELMIVIAVIWVLSAAIYPVLTGYMDRARVTGIHAFVREMKLKWELLVHYDYETIDGFGWVQNVGGVWYNLIRTNHYTLWWPEVSISWVTSQPWLWQAWYYQNTSWTRTDESIPLSGNDFIIMHWIKTGSVGWQTYTVLNTSDSNGFRFGIDGGALHVLAGTSLSYFEWNCGSFKKINDGRWHHIGAYFQYSEWKIMCYYDGKKLSEVTINPNYVNFTNQRLRVWNWLDSFFSGSIDDVMIIRVIQ